MKSEQDHLSVAQALYQLNFYLTCLGLTFTVKDIYREAYQSRRGEAYKDAWLDVLHEDPAVCASIDEPFTTHTIIETLLRTGHEHLVRVLIRRIRAEGIGFAHAYMAQSRRKP
ncbi:MAG: hypothetical protein OWT28_08980 [Firmicutes bacterium]|nr:hypothetical protein [Bacillota bacterium]